LQDLQLRRMKMIMRKTTIAMVLFLLFSGAALADTIYLKNGKTVEGNFLGFENGDFLLEVAGGNQERFDANRVARVVIDRDRGSRFPRRDSDNPPFTGGSEAGRSEDTSPFDVRLDDQWTRSQIQVNRGDRVRAEASGTIVLDGRLSAGPEGLSNRKDPAAPLPNENDGALVAFIGQDFDSPAILVGRSRTFVADRDGILFFAVNHENIRNSRGAYRVSVSIDRRAGGSSAIPGNKKLRREKIIRVEANQPWTDTGIDLNPDETFEIVAEGEIKISPNAVAGPEGNRNSNARTSSYPMQNEGVGAVIGKLRRSNGRESELRYIGASSRANATGREFGRLFIGINDDVFRDNSGYFRITIRW
jgi:hypothetical protein